MDVERFFRQTIGLPNLQHVLNGEIHKDYVVIQGDLVKRFDEQALIYAVERMSIILNAVNIRFYLEHSETYSQNGDVRLYMENIFNQCKFLDIPVCGNPNLYGKAWPGEVSPGYCFKCPHRC